MLRRSHHAAASARRNSLEVGTGEDNNSNERKEFRFPRRRRGQKPSTSRLLQAWQRGFRRRMRHGWNKNPQKVLPFAIVCTGVAILVVLALLELLQFAMSPKSLTKTISTDFEILFPAQHQWRMHKNKIKMPFPWRDDELEDEDESIFDYGGLELDFFAEDSASRNIIYDYGLEEFEYVNPLKPLAKDEEEFFAYFAFDDDFRRDEFGKDSDYEYHCRRTHQHRLNFPTCNSYHEIDFIAAQGTYLNAGAYRQVMVGNHDYFGVQEKIIFKDIHFDFDATEENYEFVRMDAIVAERLTASPRIYDIYGMCGLGILSEYFPHGDLEHEIEPEDDPSVDEVSYEPKNDLSPVQKLVVAKQMADAVADLHGHEGGIIVHQDIQLSQFLWNADRTMIKLNDFNRAEFVLFDDQKNEYCGYWEGPGAGSWRSAEEYEDKALSEKVDVFSLGNNFFAVLTGFDPFPAKETESIKELVKDGVKAPIAEAYRMHSFAEQRLAHLIDYCHEFKPKDRPTVFEIVEYLEASIRDAISRGEKMRKRALSKEFLEDDLELGQDSPRSSPQNSASPKSPRRPLRARKQPPVIRLFKQAFKVKLRRYRRVLGGRGTPKEIWILFVGMGVIAVLGLLVLNVVLYFKVEDLEVTADTRFHDRVISSPLAIKFKHVPATEAFNLPYEELPTLKDGEEFDYGELFIDFFEDEGATRQIFHNFTEEDTEYRLPNEPLDDDLDGYYYFDDDKLRSDYIDPDENCRRISEHRINFQNCNTYHELDLIQSGVTFLGAGSYRQVFAIGHSFGEEIEMMAVKDIHISMDVEHDNFEFVRMDAMVAERLSSNPRTFDIYGFCGLGIMSEFFYHGDIERFAISGDGHADQGYDRDELEPQNNLKAKEKLVLSLEMAEGIAVLHGYGGGIIVHDDIQLSQYLLNKKKTMLKINDFNRAEFMLYDETAQRYCPYRNGKGNGNWRSPEEYKDGRLNEKIDIWSLGNNMYALLTGLYPMYWTNTDGVKKAVKRGEIPYIDPRYSQRSKEEKVLVELIEKCFAYDPDLRPTIFEVVTYLRNAVNKSLRENESRADILKALVSDE